MVQEEVADVLAEKGGGNPKEIKVEAIPPMSNGLNMVWAQGPISVMLKASGEGKLKIGWTVARIDLLKNRPPQCYKCWERGHIMAQCRSSVDRRSNCYRCGMSGHQVISCVNEVACAICKEAGREYKHRAGSMESCKGN